MGETLPYLLPQYVPNEYWREQGKTYMKNFRHNEMFKLQEKMLLEYLKTLSSFTSVLELGCGFGRVTKLILSNFPDITEYVAVDLSPHQIENAKKYVGSLGVKSSLQFIVSDIQSFNTNKRFDLVIASEVLLHILPEEISQIMLKLTSFSNKHVVNIDYYVEGKAEDLAPHNFVHQYEQLYRNIPSVIGVTRIPIVKKNLVSKLDVKQSIFHATMRTS